jgi:hypothetical protein
MTTANVHTHKQIVCIRDVSSDAEQLHQIMELAVDIAAYLRAPKLDRAQTQPSPFPTPDSLEIAYCYRRVDRDDVPLFDEQLPRLVAELADFVFGYRPACAQLRDRPAVQKESKSQHADPIRRDKRAAQLTCRGRS